MSDVPQAPGWWQASDGKWYPPEQFTGTVPPPQVPSPQESSPDGSTDSPGPASQPGSYPPAFPQPGFPQPAQVGYGYGVVPPKNETLAVVALVLGLVALPVLCLCGFGAFLGIGAIATGIIGRSRIRQSHGTLTGEGMALAGIILGAVATALGIAYIAFVVITTLA